MSYWNEVFDGRFESGCAPRIASDGVELEVL